MSNIFVKGTAPFYPVPQHLINSGTLAKLSEGGHKLYQLILYMAQQHTRAALELSNRDIHKLVALSPTTIRRARTELKEAELIDLRHLPGGRYTYVVLNPHTRGPLPGRRSERGGGSPPSASFAPPWSDIGR